MTTVIIAGIIVLAALAVAAAASKRKPDVPTAPSHEVPEQLDRSDFRHLEADWLLVVFSSATCTTCAAVVDKAKAVAQVAAEEAKVSLMVHEVEVGADKALHDRYNIDAVPICLLADAEGVVRVSFLGPIPQDGLRHALADLDLVSKPTDGGTSVQIN